MPIDAKETLALAEMLRIKLSAAEADRLSGEMAAVLDYMQCLDQLDVSGIDPLGVAPGDYAPLREDVPGVSLAVEDLESLSGGLFDSQLGAFVTKPIFADKG